jgi:hypothetical protein
VIAIGARLSQGNAEHAARVWLMVLGAGAGALALYEFADITNRFTEATATSDLIATSYGAGLFAVAGGAVATFIAGTQVANTG